MFDDVAILLNRCQDDQWPITGSVIGVLISMNESRERSNNPNGRPVKSPIDLLPGACWVRAGQQRCRLTLASMERKYSGVDFPAKDSDGTGQPYLPSAVAAGKKVLSPKRPSHKALMLGFEKAHPGSLAIYESLTWDEIRVASVRAPRLPLMLDRVDSGVLERLTAKHIEKRVRSGLVLTQEGLLAIADDWSHVDALGLLLMQKRVRPALSSSLVWPALVRRWLGNATRRIFALRMNRAMLFDAVELAYPEVGPLAGPQGVRAFTSSGDFLEELANLCAPRPPAQRNWNSQFLEQAIAKLGSELGPRKMHPDDFDPARSVSYAGPFCALKLD